MQNQTGEQLQKAIEDLLATTGASRVTLRRETGDAFFPVVHEALAEGAGSIRDVVAPNMPQQPVVLEIVEGRQVIQNDCLTAFDDPDFQKMLGMYGGMRAQIVTPVMIDGALKGIISVHQLGSAREWRPEEIEACKHTADTVRDLFALPDPE